MIVGPLDHIGGPQGAIGPGVETVAFWQNQESGAILGPWPSRGWIGGIHNLNPVFFKDVMEQEKKFIPNQGTLVFQR